MIDFKNEYSREDFLSFLDSLTPNFEKSVEEINIDRKFKFVKSLTKIGQDKDLSLKVFEINHESENDPRVSLSKEAFISLRELSVAKALIVFRNEKSKNYRLSLITFETKWDEGTKIKTEFSNPRRYSFFLGPNSKTKTPNQFLTKNIPVKNFEDLKGRFSIEVVNKEFYKEISHSFTKLVGGMLKLPDQVDKNQTSLEFVVRLIGRIIFCWFLKEKKSPNGIPLIPKELLSREAIDRNEDYYHKILEPIFFEILNRPLRDRIEEFRSELYSTIPYLNGGLFSDQKEDFYKRGIYQSDFYNNLVVPDEWLKSFFEILETYNFTIDENTSYDEELSIDPEMLGRIFENLLAEINPETGESARKSTGSYYTPRIIVDYMVDESLLLYLKQNTEIEENKLKAVISYELLDDADNPLTGEEKEKIVNSLEKVKILDPACGSGAFPIGALQKIVFILQQVDSEGDLWFKKQLAKASPEFRRDIEKKFSNKEYDFLRKLGVIRECIYGVDIQPIATEISRLRCFLTLIVDEHVDDNDENRGIKPLPNLDFKFVTANSLICLPKLDVSEIQQQSLLPDNKEDIDELKKIRDDYFTSFGIEREQLKTAFAEQQNVLIKQFFRDYNMAGSAKNDFMQKITEWKPFTHKPTDWFDAEWMFGIKDGFDIVIANPPYVRISGISEDEDKLIRSTYSSVFGHYDLYIPFFEMGINLSNRNGILTYITPNKYLIKRYGNKLRPYILDNTYIAELIDTSKARTFDGVSVYPVISVLTKSKINKAIKVCVLDDSTFVPYFGTKSMNYCYQISQDSFIVNKNKIFDIYVDDNSRVLFDKIETKTKPLSQFARVLTGTPAINKYYEWVNLLFDSFDSTKTDLSDNQTVLKFINVSNVKPYFIEWGKEIRAVGSRLSRPYLTYDKELIGNNKWEVFQQNKIVIKGNSKRLTAAYDEVGYANLSLYSVMFNEKHNDISRTYYYLALLNSELLNYWYCKKFGSGNIAGGYISFNGIYLEQIPVIEFGSMTTMNISNKVKEIVDITRDSNYLNDSDKQSLVKVYEKQIDQMVYKLYGLTQDEIKIVENSMV